MSVPTLALLVAARLAIAGEPTPVSDGIASEGSSPQATAAPVIDPSLQIRSQHVDAAAVRQGLRLRVGEGWQRWAIEVDDAATPGQVDVRLRDRGGHVHARTLTLEGETVDERSRALASSLALLVEQLDASSDRPTAPPASAEPTPVPDRRAAPISGFVGVGPRVALNPGGPVDADAGVSLVGGAWLAREHLVPVGELAWARSSAGELTVNALRMGAGLLGGAASKRGRAWAGGGALLRAQWARAQASATAAGWWASPAVMGAIQYRGRILVVGAWLGADLLLPPLRARGDAHGLRWGMFRPMAALHVGLRLPPRRR